MLTPFVATMGGAAFLFAAIFIVKDRRRAEQTIECTYSIVAVGVMRLETTSICVALRVSNDYRLGTKS